MANEITMPKLSDTMTEGRLLAWKKGVGEKVERGDIIAEVETDKATMELEAFSSGILLETRIKPGEMVPVGTVIGVIGAAGEGGGQPAPARAGEEAPTPAKPPAEAPTPSEAPQPSPPEPAAEEKEVQPPVEVPETPSAPSAAGEEKASPLVRRLARERGIDLEKVKGSGPEGRIIQEDLEGFLRKQEEAPQPLSRMRAAIARTVSLAWQTIPHFNVTMATDMGEAERVRQELKESGTQLSLNDLIVKACAVAIGKFPLVNASFGGDGITTHADVNIGIAVALDDGLLVPVIRGCQGLSLKEIAAKSRDLVERVRAGKISEAEI
ncbi:MAG TPA: dihydrolipoamide acetyltransferase family protein, partial [Geobacteraceae bacterium]|nr:dihydrolipoamide acetyltransferase family protein [Geobacteraceae bacterium]